MATNLFASALAQWLHSKTGAYHRQNEQDSKIIERLIHCERSEVFLLLDYLSGRSDKLLENGISVLAENAIPKNGAKAPRQTIEEIYDLSEKPQNGAYAALLLGLKDRLNYLAHPARGVTIAYTYIFVEERLFFRALTSPRIVLAKDAFPALVQHARFFHFINTLIIAMGIFFAAIAAGLFSTVTYGGQVISRFEEDRSAHIKSISDFYSTLVKRGTTEATSPPIKLVQQHCDRKNLNNEPYEINELCNEYSYINERYNQAIEGVAVYANSRPFTWLKPMFRIPPIHDKEQANVRSVSIVLSTVTSYVLPVIFALLGAIAATIRGIHEKIRDCVLRPQDRILTIVRLPLGLMAGVAVGLFFDPSTTAARMSTGLGALSLSASAIGFLAGYGAESFFSMIDTAINRVFAFQTTARPVSTGSDLATSRRIS